jgi:hypothetical protein
MISMLCVLCIYVLILLYTCPRPPVYAPSYSFTDVLMQLYVSAYYYVSAYIYFLIILGDGGEREAARQQASSQWFSH